MNRKFFGILALLAWASLLVAPVYADRDDFDSPELNPVWIWDNPAKDSSYDLTEKPGWLKITCAPGEHDLYKTRSGGPAVVTEAPENYTIEVHWSVKMQANTSVGLVFLNEDAVGNADSEGPWCAFWHDAGNNFNAQHAIAIDWGGTVDIANTDSVYAKVEKSAKNWKFYYKLEGDKKWDLFLDDNYDIGKKHYAGMIVKNWAPGPEISAYFDYFDASWSVFSAVEPAGKLTTTWAKIKVAR